jgi:hypothetical protein
MSPHEYHAFVAHGNSGEHEMARAPSDHQLRHTFLRVGCSGGWVLGSVRTAASLCRYLALTAQVRVLSVDYRLAPEHPFPAAVRDALAAYDFAVQNAQRWGAASGSIALVRQALVAMQRLRQISSANLATWLKDRGVRVTAVIVAKAKAAAAAQPTRVDGELSPPG